MYRSSIQISGFNIRYKWHRVQSFDSLEFPGIFWRLIAFAGSFKFYLLNEYLMYK